MRWRDVLQDICSEHGSGALLIDQRLMSQQAERSGAQLGEFCSRAHRDPGRSEDRDLLTQLHDPAALQLAARTRPRQLDDAQHQTWRTRVLPKKCGVARLPGGVSTRRQHSADVRQQRGYSRTQQVMTAACDTSS